MTSKHIDATSLALGIKSGSISIEQIVNDSIDSLQAQNDQLHAATEILSIDATQLKHLPDGPLKGVPISVKECYAINGFQITSGSKRMKPIKCTEDAAVVKKLKNAGAIIVARGNTSEFLLGRETNNLLYGTTENALFRGLTAGGSSGGDGSMVASGCVAFGIGTDIGGSCRYPALFNGIIGFKPASGLIDKQGIFPVAGNDFVETMNAPGILCRSVRDARLVYNVIANNKLPESIYTEHINIYTSNSFQVKILEKPIKDALNGVIEFFKTKSVFIKDIDIPESGAHYWDFGTLMGAGFADKIYEWSQTNTGEKLSFIKELFGRINGRKTISDELFTMLLPFTFLKPSPAKLQKIITKTTALRNKYNDLLADNGILVLPTAGITAPKHKKFIAQYNKLGVVEIITPVSFCNIYNLSCITIPAWKYQEPGKTPPGIQLATAAGNEALLLKVAGWVETYLQQ